MAQIFWTPSSAAPDPYSYCGLCGKLVEHCTCLDLHINTGGDLEETPTLDPPKPLAPLYIEKTPRQKAMAKTTGVAELAIGNFKGSCYLCAATDRMLTRMKSTGFLICEPCVMYHLSD